MNIFKAFTNKLISDLVIWINLLNKGIIDDFHIGILHLLAFWKKSNGFQVAFLLINVFIAQLEDNGVTGVQTWKSQTWVVIIL